MSVRAILLAVAKNRTPWLTVTAVDVTALDRSPWWYCSPSSLSSCCLFYGTDWAPSSCLRGGAELLTLVTKNLIERIRPPEAAADRRVGLLISDSVSTCHLPDDRTSLPDVT